MSKPNFVYAIEITASKEKAWIALVYLWRDVERTLETLADWESSCAHVMTRSRLQMTCSGPVPISTRGARQAGRNSFQI